MGAGASAFRSTELPNRLDEATLRDVFGEAFEADAFAGVEKGKDKCVAKDSVLEIIEQREEKLRQEIAAAEEAARVEAARQAEIARLAARSPEEVSDDEFEEEMQTMSRKTYTLMVHMYSRNNESGSLGGEHGPSGMTKNPKAPPTLLPPSTLRSGTSHRPMPVPISFPVRCGPKATYKWLAMVAAQRYAAETSLVGQGRQREASGSAPQGTMLLPSYVSSSEDNDSFHAPDDLIFQGPSALQNGSGVWVTLDDVVPIDGDTSAPSATRWSQLAYMNQRKGKQESAASQEQALGVEREERHRILAQEAQDEKIRHKIDAMRRVLGDIVLRSEADAGLKDHYLSLAGDTMSLFDNEEDVELTLSVLEANYTSLLEVFTTHGLSHKGKTRCMTNNEFSKFAMECKALQPEKNWKISDLYHDSLVKEQGINNRSGKSKKATDKLMVNPDRPVVTTSMDMAGFLVSLRNLAFARFLEQTDGNIPADQIKELGRYKIKDVKDAVQVLLNTAVLPLIDKSAMMALVTKALGIDEVLCVYYDHLSKLRSVFEKYAGSDGVVDTMTITEFSAMIRDAGIMGMAEAKKVFVLVQQGDAAVSSSTSAGAEEKESSGGGGGAGVYDDDNLMTFAEFLAGIARIGMWKYHTAGGSLAVKISKAVDVVCSLWKPGVDEVDRGGDLAESVSDVTGSMVM